MIRAWGEDEALSNLFPNISRATTCALLKKGENDRNLMNKKKKIYIPLHKSQSMVGKNLSLV